VLEITGATLVSSDNAQAVADRVFDYYQQRYINQISIIAKNDEKVASVYDVQSMYDQTLQSFINKMETDLTGGFIAQVETTGVIKSG